MVAKSKADEDETWEGFSKKHGKSYKFSSDKKKAQSNYKLHMAQLRELRKSAKGYTLACNEHCDKDIDYLKGIPIDLLLAGTNETVKHSKRDKMDDLIELLKSIEAQLFKSKFSVISLILFTCLFI